MAGGEGFLLCLEPLSRIGPNFGRTGCVPHREGIFMRFPSSSVLQDVTFAIRSFRKNPGFVAVVVVSVALAIAANATVFSVVNATLLGSLPVREPERLVNFSDSDSMSYPDYVDYRDQTNAFDGVCAYFPLVPVSVGGAEPERVWGQFVTGNYFSVMGVRPALGRGILPAEDKIPGGDQVVVLSHGLWRRRFGSDSGIVGRQVIMNNRTFTVVGVAPAGFHGEARGLVAEFWMPLALYGRVMPDLLSYGDDPMVTRSHNWLSLVGRLKHGVSRDQARAAVNVVKRRLDQTFRKDEKHPRPITLGDAGRFPGASATPVFALIMVLSVVVGLVLAIACANVANLLLARGTARRREIGVRLAMGAGRRRLIRQLLTESVLLSALGAAAGFLLSMLATRSLGGLQSALPLPLGFDFSPDARVLCFTAALAIFTGLVFGLAPALRATRTDVVTALKDDSSTRGALRRFGMRNILVVVQVALSLVLLVSAGLFLRSLQNAANIDLGMRPEKVAVLAVDPKLHNYSAEKSRQFLSELRRRTAALPGVASMSFVDILPLSIAGTSYQVSADNREINTDVYRVGSRYFETIGLKLLGRDFRTGAAGDDAVILNENAARELFPGQNAIGRRIKDHGKLYEVIGVAANSKSRTLGERPKRIIYRFLEPDPNQGLTLFGLAILVKTSGSASAMTRPVREEIRALDRNLAVFNVETMQEHVNKAMLLPRVSAILLGIFGTAGLVLAMVGLYGVVSYSVRGRTREIGIRMAIGAPPGGVLRMVVGQGMALAGIGLVIGLAIAFALSRFTASLLYGISATDALTFTGVPCALTAVAFASTLAPAIRAARIEPWSSIRYE